MNKKYHLFAITFLFYIFLFGNSFFANAQIDTTNVVESEEEEFKMEDYKEAENTEIKKFCTSKINNLNPTTLLGVSYDFMFGAELTSKNAKGDTTQFNYTSPIKLNHGIRVDANIPLVSKSNIILNATFSYWESHYNFDKLDNRDPLAVALSENTLKTATLGILAFKPLDEKHFFILQAATSLNGNYNFDDINPDFGKMKYTASLFFGWKFSDNQNLAIGISRTYKGGRVMHLPSFMWNKTFNKRWGMELLLARGTLRYNFTGKSSLNLGYDLEGQSFLLQNSSKNDNLFATNNYEFRKSEIRPRIELNKALSSFIRLNIQTGLAPVFRLRLDKDKQAKASYQKGERIVSNLGLPMYFRIGLNFVSP